MLRVQSLVPVALVLALACAPACAYAAPSSAAIKAKEAERAAALEKIENLQAELEQELRDYVSL
ncbi:MAG: hypothetical protein ABFC80_08930, partial [Coriobacteriales bacterium]